MKEHCITVSPICMPTKVFCVVSISKQTLKPWNDQKTTQHCGSNVFQGYFDDAKESRVKQSFKQRFKNQVLRFKIQESSFKNQESRSRSRFKTQDSRIKRRLNQDKY